MAKPVASSTGENRGTPHGETRRTKRCFLFVAPSARPHSFGDHLRSGLLCPFPFWLRSVDLTVLDQHGDPSMCSSSPNLLDTSAIYETPSS
jgi:hypothetical protein